jgi:hypothetical protein
MAVPDVLAGVLRSIGEDSLHALAPDDEITEERIRNTDEYLSNHYNDTLQQYRAAPHDERALEELRLCMLGRLRLWAAQIVFQKRYQIMTFFKDRSGLCFNIVPYIFFQQHFYGFQIVFQRSGSKVIANVHTCRSKIRGELQVVTSSDYECSNEMSDLFDVYTVLGL